MPSEFDFGSQFIDSKGEPIKYKDKTLIMIERILVQAEDILQITIEETNSDYIQGIGISEEVEVFGNRGKKTVIFEYVSIPPKKRKRLKSKLPFSFEVKAIHNGYISVYNMCLVNGHQSWWHNGSCMYKVEEVDCLRFYCNDFQPNDDFNDLIFSVKAINEEHSDPHI